MGGTKFPIHGWHQISNLWVAPNFQWVAPNFHLYGSHQISTPNFHHGWHQISTRPPTTNRWRTPTASAAALPCPFARMPSRHRGRHSGGRPCPPCLRHLFFPCCLWRRFFFIPKRIRLVSNTHSGSAGWRLVPFGNTHLRGRAAGPSHMKSAHMRIAEKATYASEGFGFAASSPASH